MFCILFFGQGRKKPATKRNETKVDAKQAVNRNESTSKLNFVHGCTHDLKQRAANKRMSRQKEAKSESHMRWDEAKGLAGLACHCLPSVACSYLNGAGEQAAAAPAAAAAQKRWNYEARQDTQMEQIEIYDLKACNTSSSNSSSAWHVDNTCSTSRTCLECLNLPGKELQWTIVAQSFDFASLQLTEGEKERGRVSEWQVKWQAKMFCNVALTFSFCILQ